VHTLYALGKGALRCSSLTRKEANWREGVARDEAPGVRRGRRGGYALR